MREFYLQGVVVEHESQLVEAGHGKVLRQCSAVILLVERNVR
jgi:hypothetical protein